MENEIPKQFKYFCKLKTVENCPYLIFKDCPETCGYAVKVLGAAAGVDRSQLRKILDNISPPINNTAIGDR